MEPTKRTPGPSIARTDRARNGLFLRLARAASREPEAMAILVNAYLEMPIRERQRLAHALIVDTASADFSIEAIVREWAAREVDPDLRATLLEASNAHGCLMGGNPQCGSALFRRANTHGTQELQLRWEEGVIREVRFDPRATRSSTCPSSGEQLRPVEENEAARAVTPLLWAYGREGGNVPTAASRFAYLF